MNTQKQYYGFGIDFGENIAAGATVSKTVKIDTGSWFVTQAIQGDFWNDSIQNYIRNVTNATSTQTFSQIGVQITVGGITWFNVPIRASVLCGSAERPGFLLVERPIQIGNDIVVQLTNFGTAVLRGQLFFSGYKTTELPPGLR